MTQQQAQEKFFRDVKLEMSGVYMPWDDTLSKWYVIAQKAIDVVSPLGLSWVQEDWEQLIDFHDNGLQLPVVGAMCSAIQACSRKDLELPLTDYINALKLNAKVLSSWRKLVAPIEQMVGKRYQLMSGVPSFSKGGNA